MAIKLYLNQSLISGRTWRKYDVWAAATDYSSGTVASGGRVRGYIRR